MDIRKKQRAVVDALEEVKGRDIVVFNTERLSPYFERVIIASGDSTRQVRALADNVHRQLRTLGVKRIRIEGTDSAEWVLVDLGDTVVHVMHPTTRLHYNLEELWGGKPVTLKAPAAAAGRETAKAKTAPRKKAPASAKPKAAKPKEGKPSAAKPSAAKAKPAAAARKPGARAGAVRKVVRKRP